MSTRLQVVMSEDELEEIRAAAEVHRTTVSDWVRTVLRRERDRQRTGAMGVVRETSPPYQPMPSAPTDRVRVDVELKQALLDAVQTRYQLASRRAAIEFALRRLAVSPMSKDEALAMQGVGWDGDLDEMRSGDPGARW